VKKKENKRKRRNVGKKGMKAGEKKIGICMMYIYDVEKDLERKEKHVK
jgi:hypothetical protein